MKLSSGIFSTVAAAMLMAGGAQALEIKNDGEPASAAGCVIATKKGIVFAFDTIHQKLQLPVGHIKREHFGETDLESSANTARYEARTEVNLPDVTVGKLIRAVKGVHMHECTLNNEDDVIADLMGSERKDPPGVLEGLKSKRVDEHISMIIFDPLTKTDVAGNRADIGYRYRSDGPFLEEYFREKFGPSVR
ncbi:MAG: hypothetical protein HY370_00510 [Proteobacteria bacterium]|nr:hypothetical protein [Pseudomonadota bacterium]